MSRDQILRALLQKAMEKYGSIKPCGTKKNIEEGLEQDEKGRYRLWFNSADGSTHIESYNP